MSHKLQIHNALFVALAFFQTSGCTSSQGNQDKPIANATPTEMDGGAYPDPMYPPVIDAGGDSDAGNNGGGNGASGEFGAPPPPTQDYELDAETATSKLTGLMWLRTTLDTRFTGGSCSDRCSDLMAAGRDDWRSPTLDELKGILVLRDHCPLIDEDAFPLSLCSWYTSSETKSGSGDDYLMLSFYSGEVKTRSEAYPTQTGFPCRCVR